MKQKLYSFIFDENAGSEIRAPYFEHILPALEFQKQFCPKSRIIEIRRSAKHLEENKAWLDSLNENQKKAYSSWLNDITIARIPEESEDPDPVFVLRKLNISPNQPDTILFAASDMEEIENYLKDKARDKTLSSLLCDIGGSLIRASFDDNELFGVERQYGLREAAMPPVRFLYGMEIRNEAKDLHFIRAPFFTDDSILRVQLMQKQSLPYFYAGSTMVSCTKNEVIFIDAKGYAHSWAIRKVPQTRAILEENQMYLKTNTLNLTDEELLLIPVDF